MANRHEVKQRGVFEKKVGAGIWWIQYFDSEGLRHREKVGRKSAALMLYQKRRTEISEGKKLPVLRNTPVVRFDEIAADAIEYSKSHNISFEDDIIRMNFILREFAGRSVDAIKPQDIERWLNQLTRKVKGEEVALKPATLNRYRALLSLTFRVAVQNGKASSNPARLVRPRRENNAVIRYLLPEEERKLREVANEFYPHHVPELDLALNTGMRQGEQYNLLWENINMEMRLITIPRSKHGGVRHIELNDAAIAALLQAHAQGNGNKYVFLNCYGQKLSKPREWFEASVKKAGISRFTWHCLRHTFASRLVMAGVDLRTVQELMGHKTIQMTCRYAHLGPQHRLAAVQRLCDTETDSGGSATKTATGAFEAVAVM
jgi:site-specific recombinase XerD